MLTDTISTILAAGPAPLASSGSDSSDSTLLLWLLGPGAGVGFYVWTFLRYRNVNQRHAYERETASTVANLTGHDTRTGRVKDVENDRIRGANTGAPRTRLARSTWSEQ